MWEGGYMDDGIIWKVGKMCEGRNGGLRSFKCKV